MKIQIASGTELFCAQSTTAPRGPGGDDSSPGEPAEVIVLLHGFPMSHAMWRDQLDVLGRRYRVIAPDLRGFGQSGTSEGVVSMRRMADDVAELLDALEIDQPVHLGGLSMGGYVALAFWAAHRERLRSLILCDTRANADSAEMVATRQETAERVLTDGVAWLAEQMTGKLFAPGTLATRPHAAEAFKRMALACDPRGVAAASRGMAQREDFTERLGEITLPVLSLVGASDAVTPPEVMTAMCRAMPHGRFVEVPAAGHLAPMENPAEVNQAIVEFLGSL